MKSNEHDSGPVPPRHQFATTHWSIVSSAGHKSPSSDRALETLCETYWYPLYAYIRRRVPDVNEAQELTQAFFAELLEKNYVGTATPERGRFRAYLITALKHFLGKEWEKAKAQKRGGGRVPLSLNFPSEDASNSLEPAGGITPEQRYDQQWAMTLLDHVMDRLKSELEQQGKARHFAELKGFLIGDHAEVTYATAAARLQTTEAAAKKAASRMRKRYRELLREEIAHTVSDPSDIDDEIRSLFTTLSS